MSSLSIDVLVLIIRFSSFSDIVNGITLVCKQWRCASRDGTVWNLLCSTKSWPKNGRNWYIKKLRHLHMFMHSPVGNSSVYTSSVPVINMFCPPEQLFYSWESGSRIDLDSNCIVLVHGSPNPGILTWNYYTGKTRKFGETLFQSGVNLPNYSCVDVNNQYVVLALTLDATLMCIDLLNQVEFQFPANHESAVTHIRLFRGLAVSSSYDQTVQLWDLNRRMRIHVLRGHTGTVWCSDMSKRYIASGSNDHTVRIWDLERSGECIQVLQGHEHTVITVKFDPLDEEKVFTGGYDNVIRFWDIITGVQLLEFKGHSNVF